MTPTKPSPDRSRRPDAPEAARAGLLTHLAPFPRALFAARDRERAPGPGEQPPRSLHSAPRTPRLVRALASAAGLVLAGLALASPARAEKEWTVIHYFVGDYDEARPIEDSQIGDLLELSAVGSTAAVDLVVQMDRGPKLTERMRQHYQDPNYSGVMRYRIEKDKWVPEGRLGEKNSGDPATLYECLRWAVEAHPAKRYALIVNSHGSGPISFKGPGSAGSARPGEVSFAAGDRFVAYDTTDDDCLTVFEIGAVLEAFAERLRDGRKLELLGFDSCLTAGFEMLVELRRGAAVVVASPTLVPGTGFDYDTFAAGLARDPGQGAEAAADLLVRTFIDSVGSNGQSDVLGAWRTAGSEELAAAVSRLVVELLRARKAGYKLSFEAQSSYGDAQRYWDMGRLCRALRDRRTGVAGAPNEAAIQAAAAAVEAARAALRVSLWYDGAYAEAEVGGLSLFWPGKDEYARFRAFYKAFETSKTGFWDEFLDVRELGHDPGAEFSL